MIHFLCPSWGARLRAPENKANHQGHCPRCKAEVYIPGAALDVPAEPGTPPQQTKPRDWLLPTTTAAIACLALPTILALAFFPGDDRDRLMLGFLGFYLILMLSPPIIAFHRGNKNWPAILALSIFLGWTCIGLAAAWVWSLIEVSKPKHVHYHE